MNNNGEFSVPVDQIIGNYMVRYNRLDQLIPFAYDGSNARNINIYIDLYGLYYTLFSRSFRTSTNDYLKMTSALVSLCSHYRKYFRRIGVYCKIFFVSSYNTPEYNTKALNGYNRIMLDKLTNNEVHNMVLLNIDLMKILVDYLQDIFFITTNYESTVAIRYLIVNEMDRGNFNPNMIISKDIYPLQLVTEFPSTTLLRPKKLNNQDISEIVYPAENRLFVPSFWNFVAGYRNLKIDPKNIYIHPINFVLYSALSRFPERGIKSMVNSTAANNMIYSVVQDTPTRLDVETLYMTCNGVLQTIPETKLSQRFNVLAAYGLQYDLFLQSAERFDIRLNNLKNPEALSTINATYFSDDPLDLYDLV